MWYEKHQVLVEHLRCLVVDKKSVLIETEKY